MNTKRAYEKMVRRCEREWRDAVRREENAATIEESWKLAAASDRAARRLELARAGIVVEPPRTARNLAKGALKALATIGRSVARAFVTAERLAKAQAVNAARKAARETREALRRVVAAIAAHASVALVPSLIAAMVVATNPSKESDMSTKNDTMMTGPRKGPKSAAARPSTVQVTALFHPYNANPERMKTCSVTFAAPTMHGDEPIEQHVEYLIAMAHKAGASQGKNSRVGDGVFEIHLPDGVWYTTDGGKLLTSSNTRLRADVARFKTWDEMAERTREWHRNRAERADRRAS